MKDFILVDRELNVGIVHFYRYKIQIIWRETILWFQMRDLRWEPITMVSRKNMPCGSWVLVMVWYTSSFVSPGARVIPPLMGRFTENRFRVYSGLTDSTAGM